MPLNKNTKVFFGRTNGEKTLGTIIKVNPTRYKIRQDEERGYHRIGTVWNVPFHMATPAEPVGQDGATVSDEKPVLHLGQKQAQRPRSDSNPTDFEMKYGHMDNRIGVLKEVLCGLSPEMLTCDGEASPSFVRQRRAKLNKELEAVGVLLGLPGLTENEGWDIVTRYDHIQESTQTEAEAAK